MICAGTERASRVSPGSTPRDGRTTDYQETNKATLTAHAASAIFDRNAAAKMIKVGTATNTPLLRVRHNKVAVIQMAGIEVNAVSIVPGVFADLLYRISWSANKEKMQACT